MLFRHYASVRNELLKSPYILNVSKHNANVVGGLGNGWTTTENLKGEEVSTSIYRLSVDADYFDTYGMKLAAGRFFSKDIPTDTAKSVLVNEAAVKTFGWQKPENAIGKPFGKGDDTRYVIGVVKDFNFESLHKPVDALLIGYAHGANSNEYHLKLMQHIFMKQSIILQKHGRMFFRKCRCNIHLLMKGLQNSMAANKKWKAFFMDSQVCHCS